MSAVPRRMLLLVACALLLVAAVGWSFSHSRSRRVVLQATRTGFTAHGHSRRMAGGPARSVTRRRARAVGGGQGGSVLPSTPRPPAVVQLSSGWRWTPDPHNLGVAEDWGQGAGASLPWSPVTLPNDFNPTVSASSNDGSVAWYELQFRGPPVTAGRAWRVAFESVRRNAQVWLNGYKIGSSSDPYASFSLPATTLMPGQQNLLIVRVDNIRGGGSLPEDWWDWGGVMGPVSLQPVGRLTLTSLGVMPELNCHYSCGDLHLQGKLSNRSPGALPSDLAVTVTSPTGRSQTTRQSMPKLGSGAGSDLSFRVPVRGSLSLWSPHSPALYQVRVDVESGGRVEQSQTLKVGMRSVSVRGGILYLNGRRLWLHGAAIHEDIQGDGAALTDSDINTIVSELRSVGANITRAHYLLSPRLLDALDAAGIMVWAQAPVDHADSALSSGAGRSRALSLLDSTLLGVRSHPSVVIDSIGNELTPDPDATPGTRSYLTQAIRLARELNPGVPVGLDTYCYPGYPAQKIYSQLDVLGISHYFGWYTGPAGHSIVDFAGLRPFLLLSHQRYPKLAITISEFGAESLYDGSVSTKGTYEFQSSYLQQTWAVIDQLPFMNGAIYWTLREFAVGPGWTGGLTLPAGTVPDGIHHKGLIAYNGTPKPAFAVAQQLFASTPSFVK